jgi:hypothetical protein
MYPFISEKDTLSELLWQQNVNLCGSNNHDVHVELPTVCIFPRKRCTIHSPWQQTPFHVWICCSIGAVVTVYWQLSLSLPFQQNWEPPNLHWAVTVFLAHCLTTNRIDHGGPKSWPPRSPDLSPLNLFARAFKDYVSTLPPPSPFLLEELWGQISVATDAVNTQQKWKKL